MSETSISNDPCDTSAGFSSRASANFLKVTGIKMLFDAYASRKIALSNRIVMSPMTRSRAIENNTPNALLEKYCTSSDVLRQLGFGFSGEMASSGVDI